MADPLHNPRFACFGNTYCHQLHCGHYIKTAKIVTCATNCKSQPVLVPDEKGPGPEAQFMCKRCIEAVMNEDFDETVLSVVESEYEEYEAEGLTWDEVIDIVERELYHEADYTGNYRRSDWLETRTEEAIQAGFRNCSPVPMGSPPRGGKRDYDEMRLSRVEVEEIMRKEVEEEQEMNLQELKERVGKLNAEREEALNANGETNRTPDWTGMRDIKQWPAAPEWYRLASIEDAVQSTRWQWPRDFDSGTNGRVFKAVPPAEGITTTPPLSPSLDTFRFAEGRDPLPGEMEKMFPQLKAMRLEGSK
jgi:hypothetical protein